jgi:hypothetical protein
LEVVDHSGKIGDLGRHGDILDVALRGTDSTAIESNEPLFGSYLFEPGAARGVLPIEVQVGGPREHRDQGRPLAKIGIGDARAIGAETETDLLLHHSFTLTAHTRTGSPTPFSACSPRSPKVTPADVRASPRTISETSTSPGSERPLMREAMLTAPP